MKRAKIIPVISAKGGVGKSTVALNLGEILSRKYKVKYATSDMNNTLARVTEAEYFNDSSFLEGYSKDCDYLIVDTSDDFAKNMLNLQIIMEADFCVYVTQVEKPSLQALFDIYENVFVKLKIEHKLRAVVANHHYGFQEHVTNYNNLVTYCENIKIPVIGPLYFRKDIGATLWGDKKLSEEVPDASVKKEKMTTLNKVALKFTELSRHLGAL